MVGILFCIFSLWISLLDDKRASIFSFPYFQFSYIRNTYQAGKNGLILAKLYQMSLIVANFDNYMIFIPIFSTKLKRKKNQRMKKKMMKMRMLLIKRKTFQMIQWQVWLIYRVSHLIKHHPLKWVTLYCSRLYVTGYGIGKNISKLPPFWILYKSRKFKCK